MTAAGHHATDAPSAGIAFESREPDLRTGRTNGPVAAPGDRPALAGPKGLPHVPVATHPYGVVDPEGRWLWLVSHVGPELLAEQQARADASGGTLVDRRVDPTARPWSSAVPCSR